MSDYIFMIPIIFMLFGFLSLFADLIETPHRSILDKRVGYIGYILCVVGFVWIVIILALGEVR